MQNQLFNNVPDFTKLVDPVIFDNAMAAARELVEINSRLLEKYVENQIDLANLYAEGSEKQMHTVGNLKNPQDFTDKQVALYEEYREKITTVAGNNIKLAQDTGEEYVAWFKRNLPKTETLKTKAVKATKTTSAKAAVN